MTRNDKKWNDVQAALEFANMVIDSLKRCTDSQSLKNTINTCSQQVPALNQMPQLRCRYLSILSGAYSAQIIIGFFKNQIRTLSNINF